MKIFYKRYGLKGILYMLKCKVFTLFCFPKSRLIRTPIDIRGKSLIDFGHNLTVGKYCRFEAVFSSLESNKKIIFGKNVIINDFVHIAASEMVKIGDNVLVGSKVFISDHNHGSYEANGSSPLEEPNKREIISKPVTIEENVWIGEFVSILSGVTIGKGCIIGTMSVVNRDLPPYSIAVGSPARVIKTYNFNSNQWERV